MENATPDFTKYNPTDGVIKEKMLAFEQQKKNNINKRKLNIGEIEYDNDILDNIINNESKKDMNCNCRDIRDIRNAISDIRDDITDIRKRLIYKQP